MPFDERYIDLTIEGIRYKARPRRGDERADVLEVWGPGYKLGYPQYSYERHTVYEPIWKLYEAAVGRVRVQATQEKS